MSFQLTQARKEIIQVNEDYQAKLNQQQNPQDQQSNECPQQSREGILFDN